MLTPTEPSICSFALRPDFRKALSIEGSVPVRWERVKTALAANITAVILDVTHWLEELQNGLHDVLLSEPAMLPVWRSRAKGPAEAV